MNLGKRIMIMGGSGSGKSTLARQLGERLGLPVVHLDTLAWQPGWVGTPEAALERAVYAAADAPEWVFDGNWMKTRDYRLARADTVIYLDFNRCHCLWRVIKRRVMYHGKSRPSMTQGCNEKIDWALIQWIWGYPRKRRDMLAWLAEIKPPKQVYHLRGRRAVKRFLQQLEEGAA